MGKTIEDFLNEISEKSWRSNMSAEAGRKFDNLIEELQNNRKEIIDEIINDVKTMEKIKLNENEQAFNYSIFQTWLDYCSRSIVSDKIRENNE
jgi:hypothetical protein